MTYADEIENKHRTGLWSDGTWMCNCKPRRSAQYGRVRTDNENKDRYLDARSREIAATYDNCPTPASQEDQQERQSQHLAREASGELISPPSSSTHSRKRTLPFANPERNGQVSSMASPIKRPNFGKPPTTPQKRMYDPQNPFSPSSALSLQQSPRTPGGSRVEEFINIDEEILELLEACGARRQMDDSVVEDLRRICKLSYVKALSYRKARDVVRTINADKDSVISDLNRKIECKDLTRESDKVIIQDLKAERDELKKKIRELESYI